MPRETILANYSPDDELDRDLRPQRMEDMVGQKDVSERLRIAIDAARKRGEASGHVLFDGPPDSERRPSCSAFRANWTWAFS